MDLPDAFLDAIAAKIANKVAENLATPSAGTEAISVNEPKAAAMLGIARHRLRDARLRGEIAFTKVGKSILYRTSDLHALFRKADAK